MKSLSAHVCPNAGLWIRTLALALYAAAVLFGSYHHEPFSDEADPWVFARDADIASEFRPYFSNTGHPPLWYLLLIPFARLGFGIEAMQYLNAAFAVAAAYLLLFRSPFSLWFTLPLLASSFMAYQYAVVARGYMLMILLLFGVACAYRHRHRHPVRYGLLLGLLCNTEIFAAVPAGILALMFAWESWGLRKKVAALETRLKAWALGAALFVAGALTSIYSLLPAEGRREQFSNLYFHPGDAVNAVRNGFFPMIQERSWEMDSLFFTAASLLAWLAWSLRKHAGMLVFYLVWVGWFLFFFACIYPGNTWHFTLFCVFCVATIWIAQSSENRAVGKPKAMLLVLALTFFATIPLSVERYAYDAENPYGIGKSLAGFLKENEYDEEMIISRLCHVTAEVSAYLPQTVFWIAGENRYGSYNRWNRDFDECLVLEAQGQTLRVTLDRFPKQSFIVLSSWKINSTEQYDAERIFFSKGRILGLDQMRAHIYSVTKK
jgi:hypothetical protein